MRITLQGGRPEWVAAWDDAALAERLPASTLQRGRAYARSGTVTEVLVGADGASLQATVRGSATYAVRVQTNLRKATWVGSCACPVAFDCKHVVAVLLETRDWLARGEAAEPCTAPRDWERHLAPLVETDPDRSLAPLGLLVERGTGQGEGRLRLRPVTPGRQGRWIRTGVGWRDLEHTYGTVRVREDHRLALRALQSAYRRGLPPYAYAGYGEPSIHLDQLGSGWPSLLADLVRVGVALVGDRTWPEVVLSPEPAELVVDLRREGDEAVLAPHVRVGELVLTRPVLVGSPASGVVVDRPERLLLAGFATPLAKGAERLLHGGDVHLPADDLPHLLATYYPALKRQAAVVSSDLSVALPDLAPPLLALDVRFGEGHRADLEWALAYRVGTESVRLPLAGTHPHAVRDPAGEAALLADVRARLPEGALLGLDEGAAVLRGVGTARWVERALPLLQADPQVEVTVDGEVPAYRESSSVPLVTLAVDDATGRNDWFDLGLRVSLDDQPVPLGALIAALVQGEAQLMLETGTWFALDRPELEPLRQVLAQARDLLDHDTGVMQVTEVQAGLWEELVALGVVERQSTRWQAGVGALLDLTELPDPPLPAGLDATLRPYQREGYRWLSLLWDLRLGGVLADDMGLGKTVQALAMAARAQERGELGGEAGPLLVVAPTSVVGGWVAQAAQFCPGLRVVALTETVKRAGGSVAERVEGADVVVTSYALLRLDEQAFRDVTWCGLVLDEAQFVKNHRAKTYQCARRIDAAFTLVITGTPLENSLMDLWSLLSLAAPGLFPDPARFTEDYRRPIEGGKAPEQLERLRRRVRPLMLRRTKDEVALDLPPKVEQVLEVTLNPAHRKAYDRHLQRERQRVLGLLDDLQRNRMVVFRSLTLLRQLALDASLVEPEHAGTIRSSKLDVLLEQLTEVVAEGHRVLVFSQFTRLLAIVKTRLEAEGIAYAYLDGRTRDRPKRIAEFTEGDAPVFLISLKAGGSGLNLTQADYVFVLDPWWNPATEAQAVDRAHRIGQSRTVMVYRLVATGTIEEKVVALQQKKQDLFHQVVDEGGALGTALTADDIRGLLA